MVEEHHISSQLTPDEYRIIFKLIQKSSGESEAMKRLSPRDRTTIRRAYLTAERLRNRDYRLRALGITDRFSLNDHDAGQIVNEVRYNATTRSVQTTFRHYVAWLQAEERTADSQKRHIDLIEQDVEQLRSCLRDARLGELPDERELLEINGQDWRLDPVIWFHLSVPDFTDERNWGHSFPLIKQHMEESHFWEHYEQLQEAVQKLEGDYGIAGAKLPEEYHELWIRIQTKKGLREKEYHGLPSRNPNASQDELEDFSPYYEKEDCENIVSKFEKDIYGLCLRQLDLEKRLNQLNQDLAPHEVNPVIERGRCDKCPLGYTQW